MARRKTNAEFVAEVKAMVGDEYTFLEEYKNAKTKVIAIHNKCGHKYSVQPTAFLSGCRCPKCSYKIRARKLAKTDYEFKSEVRSLVGEEYEFLGMYKDNKTKIKVRHSKCGYEYSVAPSHFLSGKRCPKCAGNAKKSDREFQKEVRSIVGDEYVFLDEYKNSHTKLNVLHKQCGFEYLVTPADFLFGYRCPKCFGKFKKTDDEFKDEVKSLVGEEYKFLDKYKNALTKIGVIHNICGHEYLIEPAKFLSGGRCPKCAGSRGERAVASYLDAAGITYTAEYPIKYAENRMPLRIDFLADGVAIEYDGLQHFEPVEAWGGEHKLRETQRRDRIKNEYCAKHGIPMIRIPYWDFDRIDEILTDKLLPIIRNKDDKLA